MECMEINHETAKPRNQENKKPSGNSLSRDGVHEEINYVTMKPQNHETYQHLYRDWEINHETKIPKNLCRDGVHVEKSWNQQIEKSFFSSLLHTTIWHSTSVKFATESSSRSSGTNVPRMPLSQLLSVLPLLFLSIYHFAKMTKLLLMMYRPLDLPPLQECFNNDILTCGHWPVSNSAQV